MTLGTRIKECRQKAGLSQEKVAELVGVSRQAVTKWEANQSAPNTENLFRLAEIFGVSVDYLASSEDAQTASIAEQIYALYKADTQRKAQVRRAALLLRLKHTVAIAGGYLSIFALGKLFWGSRETTSVLGMLLGTAPVSHAYLFDWVLGNGLYLLCSLLSILPALFGKFRFSLVTLSSFTAALVLGEYCGQNPAGAAYGFGHYGWAIFLWIFLLGCIMGVWLQRMPKDDIRFSCRKLRIWCLVFAFGIAAIILIIRLTMFTPI